MQCLAEAPDLKSKALCFLKFGGCFAAKAGPCVLQVRLMPLLALSCYFSFNFASNRIGNFPGNEQWKYSSQM